MSVTTSILSSRRNDVSVHMLFARSIHLHHRPHHSRVFQHLASRLFEVSHMLKCCYAYLVPQAPGHGRCMYLLGVWGPGHPHFLSLPPWLLFPPFGAWMDFDFLANFPGPIPKPAHTERGLCKVTYPFLQKFKVSCSGP